MFIEALQRDLVVCAQADCARILGAQPQYWNVVSIREPHHPEPGLAGARQVHRLVFSDTEREGGTTGPDGFLGEGPRSADLQSILSFVDAAPGEPLLIHCWAGVSRSPGVALVLLIRALWKGEADILRLVSDAVDQLLFVRPHCLPNPLVVRLGLEEVLPRELAREIAEEVAHEPRVGRLSFGGFPDLEDEGL